MKNFKLIVFSLFFMFFVTVVNAETISVQKISNENLNYNFDVKINHILNANNINVVKGVIYYDSNLISNIELINSGNWKVKFILDNDKVSFITYVIGDFAFNGDSLFNIKVTLNENLEEDKISLFINDLVTTNGDNLFIFSKMEYKFENLDALVTTESEEIGEGQLNSWYDKIIEEIKNKNIITEDNKSEISGGQNDSSSSINKENSIDENNKESNNENKLVVPDLDISNKVELKNNNTGLIVVIGFVFVLFIMLLLFNFVLYKIIMNNIGEVKYLIKQIKNEEVKDDNLIEKVLKNEKNNGYSIKAAKKGEK